MGENKRHMAKMANANAFAIFMYNKKKLKKTFDKKVYLGDNIIGKY